MKNRLIVENLNYEILNNISFSLEPNTITALIGKNGSGKTLLLKCIAGILKCEGNITFNGNIIKKSLSLDKNIGIYLGSINLSEGTVLSNIIEPLNNLEKDSYYSKKIAHEITKKLGIQNLINRNINTLSYSEKNVVAFAKSVVHEPNILLVDEILNSLDNYYKDKIIEYLKQFKDSKERIVVFVTNDTENIMISDNIIIINDGKLVAIDKSIEIFKQENVFIRNGLKLPFIIDLSHKLIHYDLIDHLVYNNKDMVNELWKI